MKIVYDNIIFSNQAHGGISNYWFELIKFLFNGNDDLLLYENREKKYNFYRDQLTIPEDKIIVESKLFKSSILNRLSSVKISEKESFLFHSSYYRPLKGSKNYAEVTTVHDFTHNFHSGFHKKSIHNHLKYNSIKRADGIICISDNTYKDLIKFVPPKKNQKVAVIHNGVSDDFFVLDTSVAEQFAFSPEKNSYILYVGSRQGYKNFNFVVELIKKVKDLKLVVVGNPFSQNEISYIGNVIDSIQLISNVSNSDLNILYNNALVFIYPSSYEGFGIPVIESMKAGCPVIALNKSSIPEISGEAGILMDKLDINSALANINELRHNRDFRQSVIGNGIEQAKNYSWEKCCKETRDFYSEIF